MAEEDEKKIKLAIESRADDAGLKKAQDSGKDLEKQVEETTDALDENERAARRQQEALRRAADAAKEGRDQMEELENFLRKKSEEDEQRESDASARDDQRQTRRAVQAQVLLTLAEGIGKAGESMKTAAGQVEGFDKELGKVLTTLGEVGSQAESVVAGAAQGFSAGGPWGAAIGALAGSLKGLFDAWAEGQKMIADAEKELQASLKKTAEIYEEVGDAAASQRLEKFQGILQAELDLLDLQNEKIRLNIRLKNAREDAERRLEEIQADNERARIRRSDADAGTKAALLAQFEIAEIEQRESRPITQRDDEITKLLAREQLLQGKVQKLQEQAARLQEAQALGQRSLDSGEFGKRSDDIERLKSMEGVVRQMGADRLVDRATVASFIQKLGEETEKNTAAMLATRDELFALQRQRGGLEAIQQELVEPVQRNIEAATQGVIERVESEISEAETTLFKGATEAAQKGLEGLSGRQREEGEKIVARIREIETDQTSDLAQQNELLGQIRKLQKITGSTTEDLLDILRSSNQVAARQQRSLDELQKQVKSLLNSGR